MARKRVVSSDTTKKAVAAATSAVADSATEAKLTTSPSHKDGQPNATLPPQRQNRAQEPRALSLPLLVLLIILPLVSLLWDSECPSRPFALVRTRSTASTGGSSTRLVNPRILLITAHPSDEVLFAPTVLALLTEEKKKSSELWTVSLSSGSGSPSTSGIGEGVGEVRKVELAKSWNVMGLSRERRVVLDVPELKDNNETKWEPSAIAKHILPIVQKYDIDTFLTFDEEGATHHPNQGSIAAGIKHFIATTSPKQQQKSNTKSNPTPPRLFVLKTYPWRAQHGIFSPIIEHLSLGIRALFRDFRTLQVAQSGEKKGEDNLNDGGDVNLSGGVEQELELPNTVFVASLKQHITAWKALLRHRTQLSLSWIAIGVWGKYFWVNEWVEVELGV